MGWSGRGPSPVSPTGSLSHTGGHRDIPQVDTQWVSRKGFQALMATGGDVGMSRG